MNILDLINATTKYFQKHGVESPRLQIEWLLAHHLRLKRMDLYLQFERELSEGELGPLRESVKRRVEGEPLQHITGVAPFYGRDFRVTPHVLIPRPETEGLVEWAVQKIKEESLTRVVDVGTGSGIIALTVVLESPELSVHAVDLSPEALVIARENAERHDVVSRVEFSESNLLEGVTGEWDLILSNPPYIATDVIPTLSREVQRDPLKALDGGPDGLDLIRKLIQQSQNKLRPGGWLGMEIGSDQGPAVLSLLNGAGFSHTEIRADLTKRPRYALGQKPDAA